MVDRINTPSYSVAKQSISTSDHREAHGHGGGRNHESEKEDAKEKIGSIKIVTIDELEEIIAKINLSDYYQKKGFKFVLLADSEELLVEVFAHDGKLIQKLTPQQTRKIFEVTTYGQNSTNVGGLINVTC